MSNMVLRDASASKNHPVFGFCQVVSVITEGLPQVFGTNLVNGQVSRSFRCCTYFRHFVKPFITLY